MNDTEQTIATTLAYFDAFGRPLSKEELERWMWRPHHPIIQSLNHLITDPNTAVRNGVIGSVDGYYCLKGREDIIPLHQARVWNVEKKMNIAVRAAKKLRWVPFVQGVFVSNTVAMGSPKEESDVDFFIVVKDSRLWLSRLLVTLLLGAFRLRRDKRRVRDRACLCFYITDASLDLSDVRMFPDDIYFIYWIDLLFPVYDPHHLSERLCGENAWAKEYIPNAFVPRVATSEWRVDDSRVFAGFRTWLEYLLCAAFGDWLERGVKAIQQWKMKKNIKSVQSVGDTRVIVSDRMMKFHEDDRRRFYYEEWKKKVQL